VVEININLYVENVWFGYCKNNIIYIIMAAFYFEKIKAFYDENKKIDLYMPDNPMDMVSVYTNENTGKSYIIEFNNKVITEVVFGLDSVYKFIDKGYMPVIPANIKISK